MKEFLKKYWTHLVSYLFLIPTCILFVYFLNIGDPNADITPIALILLILMMISVVGVWAVIIYEIVKAAKSDNKNKVVHCLLIYMFNVIYAPCYMLKHIVKDPKYKIKNLIHLIISIILYILMCVLMVVTTIKMEFTETATTYTSYNNLIQLTISDEYELVENSVFKMKFDKQVEVITIGFADDESDGETVFTNLKLSMAQQQNSKLLNRKEYKVDNKEVVYESYQYDYNGYPNVATIAVLTFTDDDTMLLISQDSLLEEYDEEELINLFTSIELK